jgi:hypothetical protein
MKQDEIIYTDGRKVVITTRELIVDSARYLMNGIEAVRLHFVRHFKYPPLTIVAIGAAGIAMGLLNAFGSIELNELYIADVLVTANGLSAAIGTILLFLGLLWLSVLHDEYAIVITTVEGERNPISSTKKAYINAIAEALKIALRTKDNSENVQVVSREEGL